MVMVRKYEGEVPSFKEQIAVVGNDYLSTLGGGERSSIAFAKALQNLGFTVEIACRNQIPSKESLEHVFGENLNGIEIRKIRTKKIGEFYQNAGIGVWVNHTFMNFEANFGKIGLYALMFSQRELSRSNNRKEVNALESYKWLAANSTFTEMHTRHLWEVSSSLFCTLHPPISTEFTETSGRHLQKLGDGEKLPKIKQFLNVGRFNPGSHCKNQHILIRTFLNAKRKYKSLSDWKLILVGNVNEDHDSQRYFAKCQALVQQAEKHSETQGAVEIRTAVSYQNLAATLEKSFSYVHATGAFHQPGQRASECEHLGLSILEAMSHACIPLVYARGGIFDFLKPAHSGFCYLTEEGLEDSFRLLASLYNATEATMFQKNVLQDSVAASFEIFQNRLCSLICTRK